MHRNGGPNPSARVGMRTWLPSAPPGGGPATRMGDSGWRPKQATLSPDGNTVAIARDSGEVETMHNGSGSFSRLGSIVAPFTLVFSPDSRMLAAGSEDGPTFVWD